MTTSVSAKSAVMAGILAATVGMTAGCAASGSAVGRAGNAEVVSRESIEWLDVWVPQANQEELPRVLLIGDSITRGYYPGVESRLKGKASCARLATSKSLCDPALLQ